MIYTCKHGYPYVMCEVCQAMDEIWINEFEQEVKEKGKDDGTKRIEESEDNPD